MNITAPCGDYHIYRRCVTGANEYRYDHQGQCIGRASALVARRYPVTIRGAERTFCYEHDLEMTVFPGCSRAIFCGDRQYAKLVYLKMGHHCLEIGSDTIRIARDGDSVCFYRDDCPVAVLHHVCRTADVTSCWEHRQVLRVFGPIPEDYLLLFLSFPLLQIWL